MLKKNKLRFYKDDYKRFLLCPKFMWLMKHRFDSQVRDWVNQNLTFLDKEEEKKFKSDFQYQPNKQVKSELEIRAVSGIWFEEIIFKYIKEKKNIYSFDNDWKTLSSEEKNTFTQKIIKSKKFSSYYQPYFKYQNYITQCDLIFDFNEEGFDIYEIKGVNKIQSKKRRQEFKNDLQYQCWILNKLNYKIRNTYILHLNEDYLHQDKINVAKLFKINTNFNYDILKNMSANDANSLINQVLGKAFKYLQWNFKEIKKKLLDPFCEEEESTICTHLIKKVKSKYNWLQLYRLRRVIKAKFYLENLANEIDLETIDINHLNINSQQLRSVKVVQNIENIVKDKNTTLKELDKYKFPIYFYDFETTPMAIPTFNHTTPWLQIPFQYSIHVLVNENYDLHTQKNIKHLDYVVQTKTDPRWEFTQSFIRDIQKFGPGTYVAYNMPFEKMILKKIVEHLDLARNDENTIEQIINQTIDLMVFFKNFNIYHKNFFGSLSIKKTLPALIPNFNYENLQIQKGDQASAFYFNYIYNLIDSQEWIKNTKHLKEYCCLDSWAMVLIYQKIKNLIKT